MLELAKGAPPVVPFAERLEIVRHISFVDDVHAEAVPDKLETWREVGFDVYFKGDDWRATERGRRLEAQFAESGSKSCTSRTPSTRRVPRCGSRSSRSTGPHAAPDRTVRAE